MKNITFPLEYFTLIFNNNDNNNNNNNNLFEKIENMETDNTITPDADESKAFWGNIRDNPVDYNSGADWLKKVEDRLSGVQKQNDIVITPAKVIKQLRKSELESPWLRRFTRILVEEVYIMHRKYSLATARLLDYKPNS